MQREIPNEHLVIGAIILLIYVFHIITKRMSTIKDLPDNVFDYEFSGIATRVGDGDGFQVFHVPWFRSSDFNRHSETLPIRLAGIDAPEVRGYGHPAQPKSMEAKEFLANLVHMKMVHVRVLSIDMYSRINAIVHVRKAYFFWVNVNLKMLEAGLACVYDWAGAVYGGFRNDFIMAERRAKANRLGMWESGNVLLPMDFKNKCKQETGLGRRAIVERRGSIRFARNEEPSCGLL